MTSSMRLVYEIPLEEIIAAISMFYVYMVPTLTDMCYAVMEKHQTLLYDTRPGSVPALELISRATSIVGVMYHIHIPNIGSSPGGGQIPKKEKNVFS